MDCGSRPQRRFSCVSFNFSSLAFYVIVSRSIASPCVLAHLQVCVFEAGGAERWTGVPAGAGVTVGYRTGADTLW